MEMSTTHPIMTLVFIVFVIAIVVMLAEALEGFFTPPYFSETT